MNRTGELTKGFAGRDITCAAYRVDTRLEFRTFYDETAIIATQLFRGPMADERLAEAAEQWRLNMLAKGFNEMAK